LGGGTAILLLAAQEALAHGIGGFLEDRLGLGGEGDLLAGFGKGEPVGGDLRGDGGLGGADVLGGSFGVCGGGGLSGADAAPDVELPVDGGGEIELVEGVGKNGVWICLTATDGEADEVLFLAIAGEGEISRGQPGGTGDAGLLAGLIKAGSSGAQVSVVDEGLINEGAEFGVFEAGDPVGIDSGAGFLYGLPGAGGLNGGLSHAAGW